MTPKQTHALRVANFTAKWIRNRSYVPTQQEIDEYCRSKGYLTDVPPDEHRAIRTVILIESLGFDVTPEMIDNNRSNVRWTNQRRVVAT